MKVVEVRERFDYLQGDSVKGVELDGLRDAIHLVKSLGNMASKALDPDNDELLRTLSGPTSFEASRIQATLLDQIDKLTDPDAQFALRAVDGLPSLADLCSEKPFVSKRGMAGRVLRSAVDELKETPKESVCRSYIPGPVAPKMNVERRHVDYLRTECLNPIIQDAYNSPNTHKWPKKKPEFFINKTINRKEEL